MEISDLRVFVQVVEKGGITNAAKALHRVPSGVTARVAQLESELGAALFSREGRRMTVTGEGRELYRYATRILHLVEEARSRVAAPLPGGRFRLGAMESTAAVRLPGLLATLHTSCPDLELKLFTGSSSDLYRHLMEGRFDAVFLADPPADPRLATLNLWQERLVLIAPKGHPAVVEPDDIQLPTVLAFKEGCSYRARLFAWFREYGREPQKIAEFASYHAIMGAVAAGMGVGMVPELVVKTSAAVKSLSLHRLEHPLTMAATTLAWRGELDSANIRMLRDALEQEKRKGPEAGY